MVLASFATPLTVPSTVPVTVLQLVINKNNIIIKYFFTS